MKNRRCKIQKIEKSEKKFSSCLPAGRHGFFLHASYRGFTFVEAIIVIAVIGIMTSVTLASMSSLKRNAALKAAQSEVAAAIKLAQSHALQGKVPSSVTGSMCGCGFKFNSASVYEIFYRTDTDTDPATKCQIGNPDILETPFETQDLKNGVVLSSPTGSNLDTKTTVYFDIPHGNATIPVSPLTLTLRFGSDTKAVTINSQGSVTED